MANENAQPSTASEALRRRTRPRTTRDRVPQPAYIDLAPRDAAPRLGVTVDALWARLRRSPRIDGHVDLGGGVKAYQFGKRAWRVRFPLSAA